MAGNETAASDQLNDHQAATRSLTHLPVQALVDLEVQLRAVALATGAKLPGKIDWLHLHAHRLRQRHFFLTRDNAILKIAGELAGIGVIVIA